LVVIQAQNRITGENIRSAASIQDSIGPQQAARQVLRPWGTTKKGTETKKPAAIATAGRERILQQAKVRQGNLEPVFRKMS